MWWVGVGCVILASGAPRPRSATADPCAVPLTELRARALAHAGLTSAGSDRRRARLAGLVPDVAVRASRGQSWDDPWIGPRPADDAIARRDTVEVRLIWRLDRLVFDDAEVRARSIDDGRAKARRELARLVIRLYHRWLRLATSGADALTRAELEAELDDLTAGWFGRVTTPRPPR